MPAIRPKPLRLADAILAVAAICIGCCPARPAYAASPRTSVFIEDLTWPELQTRIAGGARTVILPSGGLEASGPQLALGKHDFVVREAAARIAQTLGDALVAPVIPVVPEGAPDQGAGNYALPGTVGLSDATFAALLGDEATGLARAGFTLICLIGDHGQSQHAQAAVAERLTAAWRDRGVRVLQVDAYYNPAGDDAALLRMGVPQASLGDHAGVADTAQLMAVRPDAVRMDRLDPKSWRGPGPSGASGDPTLASAAKGATLLRQRIAAAVAEIGRARDGEKRP